MRNVVLMFLLLLACVTATGQGQFTFGNRVPPDIDAPVQILDPTTGQCIRPEGDAWHIQLWAGPEGAPVESLQPLAPLLSFRVGLAAGYVSPPITFTVPGVVAASRTSVLVRVFAGSDWETSLSKGQAGPFNVTVAEGTTMPLPLPLPPGSLSFCIPEPSPFLLAGMGLALLALAAFRLPNQTLETNRRLRIPLEAGRESGRALHARTCVSDGGRSALRSAA